MNDKQQLAAMGEHLAEQQQSMCLQKRVEQLEALLREARDMMGNQPRGFSGMMRLIDGALDSSNLLSRHTDDAAVDRFATAMKAKLAAAREKGRGGWDDPESCSVELLADLLVGHVGKGNPGNFEDVANVSMMLHQRGADPTVLAHAATLTTCTRCNGHGMIVGVTGQTPESIDFWEATCLDCDGRGRVAAPAATKGWLLSKLPPADDSQREGGWALSFEFLDCVAAKVGQLGWSISEEAVEVVLTEVDAMLAAAPKPEAK